MVIVVIGASMSVLTFVPLVTDVFVNNVIMAAAVVTQPFALTIAAVKITHAVMTNLFRGLCHLLRKPPPVTTFQHVHTVAAILLRIFCLIASGAPIWLVKHTSASLLHRGRDEHV